MKRSSAWVAQAVGGQLHGPDRPVTASVETDSRACTPGSVYVARRGEQADGHDYAPAAIAAGAVCLVVERLLDLDVAQVLVTDSTQALGQLARSYLAELRAAGPISVVGITGSAGKTTTKDLLGQLLSSQAPTVYPVASFNNEVGCPLTVLRADEETRYLVLEMGASGRGHLTYLTSLAPLDVAVELMVGQAHLGGFGSVEQLAASKQELVEGLVEDGIAVLNADDPRVAAMAGAAPGRVLRFSRLGQSADLWAEAVALDELGHPSFQLCTSDQRQPVSLQLVGIHQVSNALAAAGAALAVGLDLPTIARELSGAGALSAHRMDVRLDRQWRGQDLLTVIDDAYNANPDSMTSGLITARLIAGSHRLVAVLGEMLELGPESAALHRQVGSRADVDVLIGVGEGSRDLLESSPAAVKHWVSDANEALDVLATTIASGDTVFLKGSYGSGVWRVADDLLAADTMEAQP